MSTILFQKFQNCRYKSSQIKKLHQSFWINQKNWFNIEDKEFLRDKYQISINDYIVGSFQRDTEGFDLKSPKLIKGPDIFIA